MRKVLVFLVVVLLAVPSVSFAGSATSRWDMTLGGYVKFDMMYATQSVSVDNRYAPRESRGYYDSAYDETGTLSWAGGETRLSWAVKGPDAWGAKTSAFVDAEFRGRIGGSEYGNFTLRNAFMKLEWANTGLLIGHTWQAWGLVPAIDSLAFSEAHFNKGANRTPQIRLTQKLFPGFTGVFALQSPAYAENQVGNTQASGPQALNQSTNGCLPEFVLDFSYRSNALGKIRNDAFKVGIGGFYGQDKFLYDSNASATVTNYDEKKLERYGAAFYWYVPIIPEKDGNKAGAFGITGSVFAGKGLGVYLPAYSGPTTTGAYYRPSHLPVTVAQVTTGGTTSRDIQYWLTNGGWVQGSYYFTDQLFMNAIYGAQFNRVSNAFVNAQPGTTLDIRRLQNAIVNVMYDVNPAIRFGLEYGWVNTVYANRASATADNEGSFHSVRVGAYYFF